jgi:hypothetical protein
MLQSPGGLCYNLTMARLVIFDEAVRGLDLPKRPVILGRSQRAEVPLPDPDLWRERCGLISVGGGAGRSRGREAVSFYRRRPGKRSVRPWKRLEEEAFRRGSG